MDGGIPIGTVVESQDGEHHRGVVTDQHPLDGWVWVRWDHIGLWAEVVTDVTVIAD